jgi:hypothetical protein
MDWTDLAQDRDQWRDLVTTIAAQLAAYQEGLSSMELVTQMHHKSYN